MKTQYQRQNFYVCPVSSLEIDLIRKLPIFFSDLNYKETDSGFYGILYRRDQDHKDCVDRYINDCIDQKTQELDNIESIRKELLSEISESEQVTINSIFDLQRTRYMDEIIILQKSQYTQQEFAFDDLLNSICKNNS